ncbi:MAG: DUF4446 family protein [Acidothermus sp.]|nr:DUF4446 family protein [Acidothermus sp.]
MSLPQNVVELLAAVGAILGLLGVLFGLIGHRRFRRLSRAHSLAFAGTEEKSLIAAVAHHAEETAKLRAELATLARELADLRADLAQALRHVAVVRYDAFGDMGGRMSFSAAVLDDAGDGLVISSIHGRTETRTYAKGVRRGTSDQPLSPEEEQAIRFALRSVAADAPAAERRMANTHG